MLVCLAAHSASQFASANHEPVSLNWQPQSSSNSYCAGAYLPYTSKPFDQNIANDQQPIYSNADTSEYTQGTTRLEGNVELRQGNLEITSDTALFNTDQNTIDIDEGI